MSCVHYICHVYVMYMAELCVHDVMDVGHIHFEYSHMSIADYHDYNKLRITLPIVFAQNSHNTCSVYMIMMP